MKGIKYEKPVARDLNELSFADGYCEFGHFVGTCVANFGMTAGTCMTGVTAGSGACITGSTAQDTCNYGTVGIYGGNCTPGGIATA